MYRNASRLGDLEALTSGNPKKMARRVKNKFIGRNYFRRINRW